MCFRCAHIMDMESGKVPSDISYEEYMEKYFWIKLPEGKTVEDLLNGIVSFKNKRDSDELFT